MPVPAIGREVGERALQRQADGQTGGTNDGDKRSRLDAELTQRGEYDKRKQRGVGQVFGEADERIFRFGFDHRPLNAAGEHARDDPTDDKDGESGHDPETVDGDQFGHAGGDFFNIDVHELIWRVEAE